MYSERALKQVGVSPIKIEIRGDIIKGVPNNDFQKDVNYFRSKFTKSYLEIHHKLRFFYGPYQGMNDFNGSKFLKVDSYGDRRKPRIGSLSQKG